MGPWWVAARGALASLHPHAPPFGWALYPPYALIHAFAGSLWNAVLGLLTMHALAAPVAAGLVLSLRRDALAPALLAGLLVALDPGLVDTALSGSKAYLGGLWVGVAALGVANRRSSWGPPLALIALAIAALNHPLAVAAAPLAVLLPWRDRRTHVAAGAALLLLSPRLWRGLHEAMPVSGDLGLSPLSAATAWLEMGGPVGWGIALGPLIGLADRRSRALALCTLTALGVLLVAGLGLGYLRDYHLRLLTIPAAAGWAAVPGSWALLGMALLRIPVDPVGGRQVLRPGTITLANALTDTIAARGTPPLVVDGAWVSASVAAEPGAVLVDLGLRGWTASEIALGGQVVVIVSVERDEIGQLPWDGLRWAQGDRYVVVAGSLTEIKAFGERLRGWRPDTRLGGAWDGLIGYHPEVTTEEASEWWPDR